MRKIFFFLGILFVLPGFSQWYGAKPFRLTDEYVDYNFMLRRYDIKFDINSIKVRAADTIFLDSLAAFLNTRKEFIIEIGEHGSTSNELLSAIRAKAIKKFLLAKKVDPAQLRSKGYGTQYPLIPYQKIRNAKTVKEKDSLDNLNCRFEFVVAGIIKSKQKTFTLNDLVFYAGSIFTTYELDYTPDTTGPAPESKRLLDSITVFLKLHPTIVFEVGAYNSSRGIEYPELFRAEKQLKNICNYLISRGIESTRLVPKPYLEYQPLFPSAEIRKASGYAEKEKLRSKNNRVEFKIISVK